MRKFTIPLMAGLSCVFSLNAQTKQGVTATRANDPSILFQQAASYIYTPPQTTQTFSGYYTQGFESTTFPPSGCNVFNVAGPTYTWARSTAQAHASTASAFMRYDAVAGGGQDWLVMPRYLVTQTTDSLTFWMRLAYSGYQPDSLCIKLSTTDSLTTSFGNTTLLKLREGTNYPGNTTTWYRYAVSLSAYVGQQVYLAFKHYDVDGDGLYVDDVTMGTLPAAEVAANTLISPTTPIGAGSVVPQTSFTNNGSATQTFNVTTTINPGGYTSTQSITSLAPGATNTATFAPWTATAGTYTVKSYSQLAGDANLLNDTITRIITVVPAFVEFGWSSMNALPAGRWATAPTFAKNCIASTDTGYIYFISGSDASFVNSTLNTRYNVQTGMYSNLTPIPASRLQVTPLHAHGKIYVIGGYSSGFTPANTTGIYDIATDSWSQGATMPTAVGDYAGGVYKDSLIYIVNGYNGTGDVNLVQIYNTYTDTWSTGTSTANTAVAGCRLGITGNNIVVVGGYSQTAAAELSQAAIGVINPLSPTTITWSALPNYPGGTNGRLGGGVSFENNGMVYFCGGDPNGQGTQVVNSVYAYNTTLNQWEVGPNMPVGVSNISGLAGAIRNDSLFLVTMGGYDGISVVSQNSWLNVGHIAPLPSVQAGVSICAGSSTTLIAMNALSYSWSPATNLSSTTTASTVANPASTITYSVTMTKAYGCPIVAPVTVTVNPLPIVTANSTVPVICEGGIEVLTGGGATSYTWDNGVGDGVPFGPVSTMTYMVTGTDANGCMNTATITIVVNPVPLTTTTSTDALCNGSLDGTAMTMVNGTSTYSYMWSNSLTTSTISGLAAGTYSVTVTDNMTGCSTMDMTTVGEPTAINEIVLNDTTWLCNGTLTANVSGGTGAYTFLWAPGGETTATINGLCAGTYTCTITDANGCTSSMNADVVTILGIDQTVSTSGISVYPNPTNGNIILTGNFSNGGMISINLVNLLGEKVMAIENNASIGAYSKTVDLNTLSSGVYYLQIIENGAVVSNQKVVKQ